MCYGVGWVGHDSRACVHARLFARELVTLCANPPSDIHVGRARARVCVGALLPSVRLINLTLKR